MSFSIENKKSKKRKTLAFFVLISLTPVFVLALKHKTVEEKPLRLDLGVVPDAETGERRTWQKLSQLLKTHVGINRFVVAYTVKGSNQLIERSEIEYDRQAATAVESGSDSVGGVLIDDGGGPLRAHGITEAKIHSIAARHGTLFIAEN